MKRSALLLMALAFALPAWAGGDASDGHTHAAPEVAPVVVTSGPRTSAASEEFELVGALDGKALTLYLDRFTSNEPVPKARIEVESGALKAVAAEVSPGVYVLPAGALATQLAEPGKHVLTISVQTEGGADLLDATLEVAQSAAGVAHAHVRSEWVLWSAAATLLLTGVAFAAIRRRKHSRSQRKAAA